MLSSLNKLKRPVVSLSKQIRKYASEAKPETGVKNAALYTTLIGATAATAYYGFLYLQQNADTPLETAVADSGASVPPPYPWSHKGPMDSFDAASIRRGYQVYREVCSACHGLSEIAFRNLNVAFTEKEIKNLAAKVDVEDGPDAKGKMFRRPAKSFDYMHGPYKNEQEARAANGGALPPDLSVIVKARPHGEDYLFGLLTGYDEAPVGVKLRDGLYFNTYFPGGAIGMAPPLSDGALEYEDGTKATVSQMAKDVTTFLAYCAKPEEEERKKMGLKVVASLVVLTAVSYWVKKLKWAPLKTRRVIFKD